MRQILKFQILSGTKYLPFLRRLFECLPKPTAARCAAALVEAVNNAVIHAHKRDKNKPIEINLKISGRRVEFSVKDKGAGFVIGKVKLPDIFREGGRGIYIIKRLMKRAEYKDNRLRMIYEM